jgi:signal transduction histidine kinase
LAEAKHQPAEPGEPGLAAPPARPRLPSLAILAAAGWTVLAAAALAWTLASEATAEGGAVTLLRHGRIVALGHGVLWAVGLVGILVAARHVQARFHEHETAALERARLERELLRAGKLEALGRLSGGIAHDFNNLLTPILGHAQLALAETPELPETAALREDLRQIQFAAERARDLTLRLLAFGREDQEHLEPLDLGRLVAGAEALVRRLLGEEVEVRVALDPAAPLAMGDRAGLELGLMSLAASARDAMPEGGNLRISTGARKVDRIQAAGLGIQPGDYAVLEVTDGGDSRDRPRLPPAPATGEERTLGPGLLALHASVRRAGGTMELEAAPSGGSTFRLLLPAAAPGEEPEPGPVHHGSELVLVVEDDTAVLHFSSAVLGSLGYRVRAVGHPEEALQLASGPDRFDLLLTDVMMPAMRGTELWKRFSSLQPQARVLFISGHAVGLRDVGGPHGATLLQKPFTPAQLGRSVRRTLDAQVSRRTPVPR